MKKINRLISLALLCVVIVLSLAALSSCGKIGAAATFSRINNEMEKLNSYEMSTKINIKYFLDGKDVNYQSEGTTIVAGLGKSDFYYYSLADIELKSDELGVDQEIMMVEAYNEGAYYFRNRTNGRREVKLFGEMGIEKFNNYINPQRYTVVDLSDCKNIKNSKNSDGTRTLECSGYSEEVISTLVCSFGVYEYLLGCDTSDVTVTLVYDKDYRVKSLSYSFSFDADEEKAPILSVSMTYSNYNSAERTDKYINPANYQKIDNIGVLTDVAIALNELTAKENGIFTLDFEQTVMYVGNKSFHKESDTVEYGTENGKFYYKINAIVSDKKTTIEYRDGKQTVKGSGNATKAIDSDYEARAFIMQLMNPTNLSITNVYDVVYLGDNVYEFKCFTDKIACHELISQYGATFSSATHTVKVTVSPYGTLTKMESTLDVEGYVKSGNSSYGLGITLKSVNEYDIDSSSSSKGDSLSANEYSSEK